jgi:hypothetical protein
MVKIRAGALVLLAHRAAPTHDRGILPHIDPSRGKLK